MEVWRLKAIPRQISWGLKIQAEFYFIPSTYQSNAKVYTISTCPFQSLQFKGSALKPSHFLQQIGLLIL